MINQPKRKNVLLVGTSNCKFLNAKFIAGRGKYVHKEIKYTVKDATEYVVKCDIDKPDVVVYQVTCNDVDSSENTTTVDKLDVLVKETQNKFGHDTNIILSLPLPRENKLVNDKARKLSGSIVNHFSHYNNVTCSDNSNLTYRSQPLEGILNKDGKHLSKWGTNLLAQKIKEELYEMFSV